MRSKVLILSIAAVFVLSCAKDQVPLAIEFDNELKSFVREAAQDGSLEYYILPSEEDYTSIPQDPKNPITESKVRLGKFLFYDTGLAQDAAFPSGKGTYSCATCHIPEAGFRPGHSQGIADGGLGFGVNGENRVRNTEYGEDQMDVQSARPLSLINVAYVTNTFWNGQFGATEVNVGTEDVWDLREATQANHEGFEGIETQNFDGLVTHRITINQELMEEYGYIGLFNEVFPEVPERERYNTRTASLAISAYIRSILSNKAPFQEWLKGNNNALSLQEKKGGIVFFGKARCSNCHYRPNLGSLEFHALGVNDLYQIPSFNTAESDRRNLGRGGFTLREEDNYKFKVPGIYNVSDAPFFFHGSSMRTLDELLDYKMAAQSENRNVSQDLISSKFLPVSLTEEELSDLKAFLENSLRDPELSRYMPSSVPSGSCFPNNDFQSAIDLGCN